MNYLKFIFDVVIIIIVLGSLLKGFFLDYYVRLIFLVNYFNKKVVLDCLGEVLCLVLKFSVKLIVIKFNFEELI